MTTAVWIEWIAIILACGGTLGTVFVRAGLGHRPTQREIAVVLGVFSVAWWLVAGNLEQARVAGFAATSLLGFALGAGVGFVFTSYDDEAASIGKVRDWLLGGLAVLTFGEALKRFGSVRALLVLLAGGEAGVGQHAAMLVMFTALGFYAMFVHRELTLNPLLQKKRNERKRLEDEGRKAAPALAAADAIRPDAEPRAVTAELAPEETRALNEFISAAQEAKAQGQEIDRPTAWKLAKAYYHREQYEKAIPLLEQAMSEQDHAVEARLKLAQAYGEMGNPAKAAAMLEPMIGAQPRPAVLKLLGYYLLWSDDRLDDAIKHTTAYLELRPNDSGAIFNLACAFAQRSAQSGSTDDKARALEHLRRAIELDAPLKLRALALSEADGDFASMKDDPDFKSLVGLS